MPILPLRAQHADAAACYILSLAVASDLRALARVTPDASLYTLAESFLVNASTRRCQKVRR